MFLGMVTAVRRRVQSLSTQPPNRRARDGIRDQTPFYCIDAERHQAHADLHADARVPIEMGSC